MPTLKGSKTYENLKAAFASEAQANRRYLYFARQADVEGYPELAGLFRDTAEGESGHAYGFLDHLRKIGDPVTGRPMGTTVNNLEAAIAGEAFEYTNLYPDMAATARTEGFPEIADWFETLLKAEHNHAERFQRGLDSVQKIEKELRSS
jgi:rubrerythrin